MRPRLLMAASALAIGSTGLLVSSPTASADPVVCFSFGDGGETGAAALATAVCAPPEGFPSFDFLSLPTVNVNIPIPDIASLLPAIPLPTFPEIPLPNPTTPNSTAPSTAVADGTSTPAASAVVPSIATPSDASPAIANAFARVNTTLQSVNDRLGMRRTASTPNSTSTSTTGGTTLTGGLGLGSMLRSLLGG